MSRGESKQHALDRVRRPRVHLTYDVDTNGAIQQRELPFVVGVLADLSGKPDQELVPLKKRDFVDIHGENFDEVLAGIRPRLDFTVSNTIQGNDSSMRVELRFSSMDDFAPEEVARQVEPIRKLLEARALLADLLSKVDGNDNLDALLQSVVTNTDKLQKLGAETGRAEQHTEEA
jgi:type VI secretion system protein ImpB